MKIYSLLQKSGLSPEVCIAIAKAIEAVDLEKVDGTYWREIIADLRSVPTMEQLEKQAQE